MYNMTPTYEMSAHGLVPRLDGFTLSLFKDSKIKNVKFFSFENKNYEFNQILKIFTDMRWDLLWKVDHERIITTLNTFADTHSLKPFFYKTPSGSRYVFYDSNTDSYATLFAPADDEFIVTFAFSGEFQNTNELTALKEYYDKLPPSSCPQIGIIIHEGMSYRIKLCAIQNPTINDISVNYGGEFIKHHKSIIEKISDDKSGLFIFHGEPGTGKSSYIKQLKMYTDRKFVYIPEFMISQLNDPKLLALPLEDNGVVLILEDAEKYIQSRDTASNNTVSTILNLSDGILSNILNCKIILTFNTSYDNIDKALLRKGRLRYNYKFDKLSIADSQKLIDTVGIEYSAKEPMSLAEIFYLKESNNLDAETKEVKPKIGF